MTLKTVEPTPRQQQVLEWVKEFIQENGMPPTVREIGAAFGIKSSSVFDLLTALERKGHLRRGNRSARSLIVAGMDRKEIDVVDIPIIGTIAAGRPIEAIEDDRGRVVADKGLLRGRETFALRVEGDSMVDAGIFSGDYVMVWKQETADNGDIVVALIGEEATLKRFYREKDGVRLEPANPALFPIHVRSGQFRILGKVIGVQRFLDSPSFRARVGREPQ
ncbi:MAG: transcriptional repressor LexA [Deltaproteobacteria bacterium]|nr:transcriptional repressor LexA [Deltaproteobacteria bacterium]